jgi:hypothetical protein
MLSEVSDNTNNRSKNDGFYSIFAAQNGGLGLVGQSTDRVLTYFVT